jgi:hypothetical protein
MLSRQHSQELLRRLILQEVAKQLPTDLLERLDTTVVVRHQDQRPPRKKSTKPAKKKAPHKKAPAKKK